MAYFIRNRYTIGLDLQAEEVRLVKIKSSRQGKKLDTAMCFSMAAGIISQGHIVHEELLIELLKNIVSSLQLRKTPVAMAIPQQQVIRKEIEVPKHLNSTETREFISYQLGNLYPGKEETVCFDYHSKNEKVHLSIISKSLRDSYIRIAQKSGLNLKVIDLQDDALLRAIEKNAPDKVLGILHIEDTILLLIVNRSKILFKSAIVFNEEEFTKQIYFLQKTYSPEEFVLTGNLKNISEIADRLTIPYKMFYPSLPILNSISDNAQALALAIGLAIRDFPTC